MPKLCLVKTKYKKIKGSELEKEAITDAEMFENNIKAYFTASAVVLLNETKQDLLKNLKKRDDDIKILLILIMFSSGEFKEIGTSVLFTPLKI